MTKNENDEAAIRDAAYLIWIDEGRPNGRDEEHWQRAIEMLNAAQPKAKKARKAPAKPLAAKASTTPKSPAAGSKKPKTPAKKPAAKKPTKAAKS